MQLKTDNPVLIPFIELKEKIQTRTLTASTGQAIHLRNAKRLLDACIKILDDENDMEGRYHLYIELRQVFDELHKGGFW